MKLVVSFDFVDRHYLKVCQHQDFAKNLLSKKKQTNSKSGLEWSSICVLCSDSMDCWFDRKKMYHRIGCALPSRFAGTDCKQKTKEMSKRKPNLIFTLLIFRVSALRNHLGRKSSKFTPAFSQFGATSHHGSKVKERLSGWFLQSPAWTAARNKVDPWPHGDATPDLIWGLNWSQMSVENRWSTYPA